jgi:hypothetical protein
MGTTNGPQKFPEGAQIFPGDPPIFPDGGSGRGTKVGPITRLNVKVLESATLKGLREPAEIDGAVRLVT